MSDGDGDISWGAISGLIMIGFVIGLGLFICLDHFSGRTERISTPITDLEPGRIYEVKAIYREGISCFLLLKPDGETSVKYYNLSSSSVPEEVVVGQRIAELSNGITILP